MYQGMTEETRLQIELGLGIAKDAKADGDPAKSVMELIQKCLKRDPGWKKYYIKKVKVAIKPVDSARRSQRVKYAQLEREAWQMYIANRGDEASESLQRYVNATEPPDDVRAWLLQRAAWYVRAFDITKSLVWQKAAHERDRKMLRPPKGVQYPRQTAKLLSPAVGVLEWYRSFEHTLGAIAAVNHLRSQLVFDPEASSEHFEDGLRQLGTMLGFSANRPEREYGEGPDVLWLLGQSVFPIEAKNRVQPDVDGISKHDAGQLTQSTKWAEETFAERKTLVPVIAHPSSKVGLNAFPPDGTRVLTPRTLESLIKALNGFVLVLNTKAQEKWEVAEVEHLLQEHKLSGDQLVATFTVKVER
jgi:hypothetical protein